MLPSFDLFTTSIASIKADDINDEKRWYPAYTTLLSHCFLSPNRDPYLTTHNYGGLKIGANSELLLHHRKGIDLATLYVVNDISLPVLFVEIKPPRHLEGISTRAAADKQMRDRFTMIEEIYRGADMDHVLHSTTIYGISAMGPRFAVYSFHQREVTPQRLWSNHPKRSAANIAPAENWKFDLLDGMGHTELESIVIQTRTMVTQFLKPLQHPMSVPVAQKLNGIREKVARYAKTGRKRSYDSLDVSPNEHIRSDSTAPLSPDDIDSDYARSSSEQSRAGAEPPARRIITRRSAVEGARSFTSASMSDRSGS
jgi:hypothetical protein